MKKVALTFVLLLLVGITLPSIANAHTPCDPFEVDLIAGGGNPASEIDVGDVLVWNDARYLYVKYRTICGWVMTETHLHIFTESDFTDVPHKNGNPIPGHFDYSMEHEPPVSCFIYTIPLEWTACTDVYIAAHAAVAHVSSGSMLIVSDATAQWSADGTTWQSAVACWAHPSWNDIPGATWIWRTYLTDPLDEYNTVPAGGWWFRKGFTLPSTAFGISASAVAANGDNAYTIGLNGVSLVPGGDGVMDKDDPNHGGWSTVINHVIPSGTITPGYNELQLRAMNYYDWGDSYSNPAGLAFKVKVCYCYFDMEETAWGAACVRDDFPGKNWATYFTYHVQEVLVDTVTVPSDGTAVSSAIVLEDGVEYRLEASGTYFFRTEGSVKGYLADAEWALRHDAYGEGWVKGDDYPNPQGLDLTVGGLSMNVDWGPLDEVDHIYSMEYMGAGSSVAFQIFDSYYGDNSGSLTVKIYWIG